MLAGVAGSAQIHVPAIRGGIALGVAVEQLHGAPSYPIEKVPVVRDHYKCVGPTAKKTFEPFDGRQIQVVGRLIEQQHIRLFQQQPAEVGARPLPAGELAGGALPALALEAEAAEHPLGALLVVVAALVLEAFHQGGVLLEGLRLPGCGIGPGRGQRRLQLA